MPPDRHQADRFQTWGALALIVVLITLVRSAEVFGYSTWIIDEERIVTTALGFLDFDLDPRWFNYHTLPMYILGAWFMVQYGIYLLLGLVGSKTEFVALLYSNDAHVYISAKLCFSLVYGLGCLVLALIVLRRTGSRLGAVLCLLLPLLLVDGQAAGVQVRTDTFVFLFLALTVYFACFAEPRPRNAYLAMAACAAAFASKFPAIVLLPVLLTLLALHAWRGHYRWWHVVLAGALFPLFVVLFMPYMVLDWEAYRPTLERVASRASGSMLHVGKAYHFGLMDKLSHLLGVIRIQIGVPTIIGMVLCGLYGAWRDRRLLFAVLFVLAYVVAFSTSTTLDGYWMRPAYPFAIALTILGLLVALRDERVLRFLPQALVNESQSGNRPWRGLLLASVGAVLCFSLWGGARGVANGFRDKPEDTRVIASAWIAEHLPAGASVVLEGFLPHYLPHVFSHNPKTELGGQNYLMAPVTGNQQLMNAFYFYMQQAAGSAKRFNVRLMSENMRTGYDPRAVAFRAGEYVVISSAIYRRFDQPNLQRQSPQLAHNAQVFYRFVRSQQPVKIFEGRGPTIEIYRMRGGPNATPQPG